ncbi:hypothetical protein H632_c3294p0, partial [Helicosporidium sp. ATCC 50920]
MTSLRCLKGDRSGLLYLAFNQDNTCISVSDMTGIRIFTLEKSEHVLRLDMGAISIAQMLYCTSLLAYVGAGEQPSLTPRRVTLLNTATNLPIQQLTYSSTVLAVLLNREHLVVVCELRSFVYLLRDLGAVQTIEHPSNPRGVGALSGQHEPCSLLALPSSSSAGLLRLYELRGEACALLAELRAHSAPLACLTLSPDGQLLASAS